MIFRFTTTSSINL